ncbi:hypothetical protein NEF87_003522 [Candidatus Lokiarchaeum ossiferum]|uniref:Chromosome partition protein Smc n=1 Tax=Candidatus Lokiarchaeum ossiferum TaxID=2951803 RepID=A0ABY6HUP1_9ARCH|nr:hypothetical protein NEF87_003522 [Candidatus Lokiarchaeum sp. B-35]
MISLWEQVKELENKGKINKTVKVMVSDLIAIREKLFEQDNNLSVAQAKIADLLEKKSLPPQNINHSPGSASGNQGKVPIFDVNTVDLKNRENAIEQKESELKIREEQLLAKEIMVQSDSQAIIQELEKKLENREEIVLQFQQQMVELRRSLEEKSMIIDSLNQQNSANVAVPPPQMELNRELDEEIIARDAEISKLHGIISDFESKNGVKDLGSLESQLKEMTKDAQSQQEILEFKNQELLAAQSLIETQKAELAQAMIELGEERKRMDKEIALQKAVMSGEIEMQKSAMSTEIENVNLSLQDTIAEKTQEIAQLKAYIEQLSSQTNQANTMANTEKDSMIAQLQANLKQAESIYNSNQVRLQELTQGNQSLQKYIEELKDSAIAPEKYNQLMGRLKETESNYSTLNQNFNNLTQRYHQLEKLVEDKDRQIKSLDQAHSVMAPSISGSSTTTTSSYTAKPVSTATISEPASVFSPSPITPQAPPSQTFSSARVTCTKCNSTSISIVEDKTKILTYAPSIVYAKKHVCKQCGNEF